MPDGAIEGRRYGPVSREQSPWLASYARLQHLAAGRKTIPSPEPSDPHLMVASIATGAAVPIRENQPTRRGHRGTKSSRPLRPRETRGTSTGWSHGTRFRPRGISWL